MRAFRRELLLFIGEESVWFSLVGENSMTKIHNYVYDSYLVYSLVSMRSFKKRKIQ